ncbi:L-glutamate gamma-semialdehyde dehydrogenase [Pseudoxanthomonas sp. SORGH_AS_0997]|uniref:Bifunctional protein PutA n=1 Tax=Pseudoxanthomonas winnipegensis TaxID=2480810 RepID=A0AAW8GJ73_9GAMM|nr:L-glutamate gamma-semialdehyde dehydrogenase [Pseudoxanthomonas sp. SORGH_AS_0997]MDQ1121159.1 RHH-type proline utilization regulon transcriptional repressor/proline dehydrogenase/delta 1-pyrroline-5-carboxylate dehydrogenase [Pseudoxanthomonas winnipegensis]MDQ1134392.1 RHH-type proline utilization regulon transcriptional repressor/proline dehydrogenase/delta 1-pyrroline-5-carboxylate dehydrogenase [Pseudoxanthomonas winnipegensis]MDR6139378.1 RHH-type proline utilization regulon transcripti
MRLPLPYRPEADVLAPLLQRLQDLDWALASGDAIGWIGQVRAAKPSAFAMETLLREFPLSSAEGLALMRLAEALLRVPDADTAMTLTADQLGRADFSGASQSWLATLSNQAISLSKKMLGEDGQKAGFLARMGAKAVVAATVRAVQLMGKQFVMGETLDEALDDARKQRKARKGLRFSYDMLGEGARTDADAQAYMRKYHAAIAALAKSRDRSVPVEQADGISIKLSAIDARYEAVQHDHVMALLVPRVCELAEAAAQADLNLTIDAEESERLELSLEVFEAVATRTAARYPQWNGFGLAVQAYQTRALETIEEVARIARALKVRFMVRLVKGAYWDYEIKRAQELGLAAFPVFTHKHHTDLSYLACARAMLAMPDAIYPQIAGHNAGTIAAVLHLARAAGVPFELQRLHGMGDAVHEAAHRQYPDVGLRVYAPVGPHKDLLAYLVRRLLENGANSSFVHQLADETLPASALVSSPLHIAPQSAVTLPADILGARRNTAGTDVSCEPMARTLLAAYPAAALPTPALTPVAQIDALVQTLAKGQKRWNATPVQTRAAALEQAADALERDLAQWCALIVREGHRTWGDAVSEVREAADFCRYYALQARGLMAPQLLPGVTGERNTYALAGRGVWACISPWNFPLAIFTGQVVAALVTGNAVAAKPAEQTPGVGAAMIALLHRCGVPEDALVGVYGAGETGAALVAHPKIAGVAFTGSTPVAKAIARTLAGKDGPIVPLIAETGGLNAMIVDSTALPEQVVDAVVQSTFRSAGQRCSALRVLCVQDDIADGVIEMLAGAIALLQVGDPSRLSSDLGPVIDQEAFDKLQGQIAALEGRARLIARAPLPADAPVNSIAPVAFEIGALEQVREEVFGPVLQVLRWKGEVETLVEQINALGYGLTLGVQTRIDTRAQAIAAQAEVGNVYVNRNMIGAVVGVQPFGGEGLSGTGPKAGGPNYLPRFCSESVVTVNTTAAGGDVDLLMASH